MMVTTRVGKQRKRMWAAPLHIRQKLMGAHLAKPLIKLYGKRSLAVRKGDEVKVMRGKFNGVTGKVSRVDLNKLMVYIENVKTKKVAGQEVQVGIRPSKLLIINPVLEDKWRKAIIERSGKRNKV